MIFGFPNRTKETFILLIDLGNGEFPGKIHPYREIVHSNIEKFSGVIFKEESNIISASIIKKEKLLSAVLSVQYETFHKQLSGSKIKPRLACHFGHPFIIEGEYLGNTVSHTAQMLEIINPGQILFSQDAAEQVKDFLPKNVSLPRIGSFSLPETGEKETLFQFTVNPLPSEFGTLKTFDTVKNNLPAQKLSEIGRDKEIQNILSILKDKNSPFIEISGERGIGKTRFAYRVAELAKDLFKDGVFTIDLKTIPSTFFIAKKIKESLGLFFEIISDNPISDRYIRTQLENKNILLVVENFEKLDGVKEYLESLSAACKNVTFILIGKKSGIFQQAQQFHLNPLPIPAPKEINKMSAKTLLSFPPVKLATELYLLRNPAHKIDLSFIKHAAEFCTRLKGYPGLIDMVLLQSISTDFEDILTEVKNIRTPEETGSLYASVIEYFEQKLSQEEKEILLFMASYPSGLHNSTVSALGIEPLCLALENKGWLKSTKKQEQRYLIADWCFKYFAARPGEQSPTKSKYEEYLLLNLRFFRENLNNKIQKKYEAVITAEYDNICFMISALFKTGETDAYFAVLLNIFEFWTRKRLAEDSSYWTKPALKIAEDLKDPRYLKLLSNYLVLEPLNVSGEDLEGVFQKGITLAQKAGDKIREGHFYCHLGWYRIFKPHAKDYSKSEVFMNIPEKATLSIKQLFETAYIKFREGGKTPDVLYATTAMSMIYNNQPKELVEAIKQGEDIYSREEYRYNRASIASYIILLLNYTLLNNLEALEKYSKDYLEFYSDFVDKQSLVIVLMLRARFKAKTEAQEEALILAEKAYKIYSSEGNNLGMFHSSLLIQDIYREQGNFALAYEQIFRMTEIPLSSANLDYTIGIAATVLVKLGETKSAIRLASYAKKVIFPETANKTDANNFRENADLVISELRKIMGEQEFAAEWSQGFGMTGKEALELIRSIKERPANKNPAEE